VIDRAGAAAKEQGQGRYLERLVRLGVRAKGVNVGEDARILKKHVKFLSV